MIKKLLIFATIVLSACKLEVTKHADMSSDETAVDPRVSENFVPVTPGSTDEGALKSLDVSVKNGTADFVSITDYATIYNQSGSNGLEEYQFEVLDTVCSGIQLCKFLPSGGYECDSFVIRSESEDSCKAIYNLTNSSIFTESGTFYAFAVYYDKSGKMAQSTSVQIIYSVAESDE